MKGEIAESTGHLETAIRLAPQEPSYHFPIHGLDRFYMKQVRRAIALLKERCPPGSVPWEV